MSFCTSCGAQLGFGRFCTNCGQATPGNESTPATDAETTQVRLPRVQPDASTGPRFPLYADATDPAPGPGAPDATNPAGIPAVTASPAAFGQPAAGGYTPGFGQDPSAATAHPYPAVPASAPPTSRRGKKKSPWPWIALAVVLLLGVGGGAWALLGGDDDNNDASGSETTSQAQSSDPTESDDPNGSSGQPSEPSSPDTSDQPEGDPVDLAGEADVEAPQPRAPGQAADGTPVRYPASNMLDSDPTTSYQISGDASGSIITFSFDSPVTLREVGMINGYAKSEGGNNWYAKNRKVLEVEWSFDDGTSVAQTLRRTTDLQVLPLDSVTTQTVTLTLTKVSKPGSDPRDNTAISSVLLRGVR